MRTIPIWQQCHHISPTADPNQILFKAVANINWCTVTLEGFVLLNRVEHLIAGMA